MSIFEYAMKMEQDGRAFYLEHAAKIRQPELKRILEELAHDELKHYNIFKAMHEGLQADYKESEKTTILNTVKNVFEELKAADKEFSFPPEAKRIWEQAQEVEKKTEDFYRVKAAEVTDPRQKNVLSRIADEEHRHWVTMQNVIEFLDRPNHWLEDAEWSDLGE
ncbi:MAG: ferritin family protein [Candidatus Zixiibacteriota bacterium]